MSNSTPLGSDTMKSLIELSYVFTMGRHESPWMVFSIELICIFWIRPVQWKPYIMSFPWHSVLSWGWSMRHGGNINLNIHVAQMLWRVRVALFVSIADIQVNGYLVCHQVCRNHYHIPMWIWQFHVVLVYGLRVKQPIQGVAPWAAKSKNQQEVLL